MPLVLKPVSEMIAEAFSALQLVGNELMQAGFTLNPACIGPMQTGFMLKPISNNSLQTGVSLKSACTTAVPMCYSIKPG
jgi:hypothetical protein